MAYIVEGITLEQVKASKPQYIYYAVHTCWWTHDPRHLCRLPDSCLPCDPRGSVLFETSDVDGFLTAAESNPEHYGKHGLKAFMAAHHLNCRISADDPRSTSLCTWDEYNAAIDAQFGGNDG